MSTFKNLLRLLAVLVATVIVAACGKKDATSNEALSQALTLQSPFCTYPIKLPNDVDADHVAKASSRPTSLGGQLVALEQMGLVRGERMTKENNKLYGGTFTSSFVRFTLTEAGKKVAIARWPSDAEMGKVRICYAKRQVTGIVETKPLGQINGVDAVEVIYNYLLTDAAPFLSNPAFQKSFTEVNDVLTQAGKTNCHAIVKFPDGKSAEVAKTPDGFSGCQGDY